MWKNERKEKNKYVNIAILVFLLLFCFFNLKKKKNVCQPLAFLCACRQLCSTVHRLLRVRLSTRNRICDVNTREKKKEITVCSSAALAMCSVVYTRIEYTSRRSHRGRMLVQRTHTPHLIVLLYLSIFIYIDTCTRVVAPYFHCCEAILQTDFFFFFCIRLVDGAIGARLGLVRCFFLLLFHVIFLRCFARLYFTTSSFSSFHSALPLASTLPLRRSCAWQHRFVYRLFYYV